MKKYLVIIILAVFTFTATAQDNKSKTILDKVSAKNKAYKTLYADFTFNMDNKAEDIHEISEGKIALKGNKYKLSLMGVNTYFDGKTQYAHLLDAEEVNITTPDNEDKEALNPATIFTIYQTGFQSKFVQQKEDIAIIDLFPTTNKEEKSFSKIRLWINTKTNQIQQLKSMGKDGNNITIKVNKIVPNIDLPDSDFIFDTKANPDVEINDLR